MLNKIYEVVPYKEYMFRVQQNDIKDDSNLEGDISFACHAMSAGELGPRLAGVVLRPLWNLDWAERELLYRRKFKTGDYFQQSINNKSGIREFADILHDFLLEEGPKYAIYKVFSTLEEEDEFSISPGALKFWKRRVSQGKAQFDDVLKRYCGGGLR